MPGYETNRFLQAPANEFLCLICYDVLNEPVIVPECEHVFCRDCLVGWLSYQSQTKDTNNTNNNNQNQNTNHNNNNNNNHSATANNIDNYNESKKASKYSGCCPVDRALVNTDELPAPQRAFRNLLSALHIRCSFAPFCEASTPLCDLKNHENNCAHNPENTNKTIDCPKNCGAHIRIALATKHDCVQYLKERLEQCERRREDNSKKIEDLIQEKQSLIETIQTDTNRYESIINRMRTDTEKMKKSYEKEIAKLKSSISSNYSQLARRLGNGTSSLHLPSTSKSQSVSTLNGTTKHSVSAGSHPSGAEVVRKSSLDNHLLSDAFSFEPIPSELPPPLTPSKLFQSSSGEHSSDSCNLSRFYSESIPNLSFEIESSSQCESPPIASPSPSSSSHGVVRNAMRMFNRLPTMIPYVNPPAQLSTSGSTSMLASLDLTDFIRRHCQNEKIVQVMSLVDRRHFYPSNEYYKCLKTKHGAHSLQLIHELKLLDIIEPLINGESRILDIGSGHGFLTVCLAQIAKYVVGVEHGKELYQRANDIVSKNYAHLSKSKRIEFIRSDGRFKCWKGTYDLILVEAIIKNQLPSVYLSSLRPKGSVIAVLVNNSRLQLCRIQVESERQIIQILNRDHDYLSQQYRDFLCDIKRQETTILNRFRQF